jgi:hypothetical protein
VVSILVQRAAFPGVSAAVTCTPGQDTALTSPLPQFAPPAPVAVGRAMDAVTGPIPVAPGLRLSAGAR